MFESLLAKYGYVAVLLGTVFEGETIMIMGGFSAHRRYFKLLLWVILASFVGNFIQNQVYLELIRGEIKHLEVPILVGIAVISGLWLFFNHRRHSKLPVIQN